MITFTISDSTDTMSFSSYAIKDPLVLQPDITETDVKTLDGNISTYYSSTKETVELGLGNMTQEQFARLRGFVTRQYQNYKYPTITVTGASANNINNMTAKISIVDQRIVNECGLVEDVTVNFRESKQMP